MGDSKGFDLKARLKKPLFRRSSTFSSTKSSASDSSTSNALAESRSGSKSSLRLPKSRKPSLPLSVFEEQEPQPQIPPTTPIDISGEAALHQTPATSPETPFTPPLQKDNPKVVLEAPTPSIKTPSGQVGDGEEQSFQDINHVAPADAATTSGHERPGIAVRRQSIVDKSQSHVIADLLRSESPQLKPEDFESFTSRPSSINMARKKIWVKRPGSSATQVMINEEDLVDDVRDMILRKYANSLGRNFDSPDVTLRIIFRRPSGRHSQTERTLGPEEAVAKILEMYYPGGQAVEEALIIDVPQRRTPKHSPHLALPYYLADDARPRENGTDYFPPMPPAGPRSPHLPTTHTVSDGQRNPQHPTTHSMAVLTTGQLPNLPSPGIRIPRHSFHRPRIGRQHTTSPTVMQTSGTPQQPHSQPGQRPSDKCFS